MEANGLSELKRLLIWSGDWELPSVDVGCLQIMAYTKFAGCPLKLERCNNPLKSPSWQLPVLKSEDKLITSSNRIMDYLREKNFNADYYLTAKQGADTLAFSALVQDKLYPAILYSMWIDSKNYSKVTRPWYAGVLPLPLNWIVPGRIARNVEHILTEGQPECNNDILESKINRNALECLTLLSEYLGDKEFFFGASPTTLDAVVFAHLAVILKVPLPNSKLSNQLRSYDNLVRFTLHILHQYFPVEPQDDKKQKTSSPPTGFDESLGENETRNKWLWAGFVIVSMATYACLTGIIKLQLTKKDTQEDNTENLPDMTAFSFQDDGSDDFDGGE